MSSQLLRQSGLSLERLLTFCMVAEAGGVTKAAGGEAAKQSLFSRQVKELEEFFGIELVRRTGRGMILTEAGTRLHRIAREALTGLVDFKAQCSQQPVELAVGAGETLIQWLILPRLGELRSRLSNIGLKLQNLSTKGIVTGLAAGTIDAGLLRSDAVERPLKSLPLGNLTYSAFVPTSVAPAKAGASDRSAVLDGVPMVTLEGDGQFRRELASAFEKQKIKLNIQLECPSFPLVARAVMGGHYAAVLPTIAGEDLRKSAVREATLPFLKRFERPIHLAWNPRLRSIRPALDKALDILRSSLSF